MKTPLIIGLHRVGYPPPAAKIRGLFITPRLLAFQLALLRQLGYRFVTLVEACTSREENLAAITFDDGYRDNLIEALPVLQRFGAPATVFVITGDVGKRDVVWSEAGDQIPADLLSWEELSRLQSHGWEIGSHGHNHVHLARYSYAEQLGNIIQSVDQLQRHLGVAPTSFAYPYGSYDRHTIDILHQAGFRQAVTSRPPRMPCDRMELDRICVGGRNLRHLGRVFGRTIRVLGPIAAAVALGQAPRIWELTRANSVELPTRVASAPNIWPIAN